MEKIDQRNIIKARLIFQWALFAFIIYGGVKFYFFVEHFLSGGPIVERPTLVDGFLPIGALMSFRLWLTTGIVLPEHPAALVIFVTALFVSLVLMKSFCGWICPVGTLSEALYKLGERLFGRNITMPPVVDYPLRALKYALLMLFAFFIFIVMPVMAIYGFMGSDYWKIADVNMLFFFTDMSAITAIVLTALVVLSMIFRNFWCRYLCPYGALTGILGLFSPVKIARDDEKCIHCHKCTQICPNMINVERATRVISPECSGCLSCVGACPAKGALEIKTPWTPAALSPKIFAALSVSVFFALIWLAMLSGMWKSSLTYDEYREIIPRVHSIDHP